ncbi:hypothetical protein KI387_007252, partial [Taxus chinensis]
MGTRRGEAETEEETRMEEKTEAVDDGSDSHGRGTWIHAAFHVATTIATPAAYAPLPFALASLTWSAGVVSLVNGTLVTWYSSFLVASLWKWNGIQHTTYRKLAHSIFGAKGYWAVTFFQQIASVGNNIAIQIAAGSSLKAIYKHYHSSGNLTLQEFIIFFGVYELFLSQFPDIHSLRWVNAICTFSTMGFAATAIGVALHDGMRINRNSVDYQLHGTSSTKIFKGFNALGTIAFSFGDAMLPEIQSTLRDPAKKNMYRGVSAAYTVIILSYWTLAFGGYWAFGSAVESYILNSLTTPAWAIVMANIFAVVQISGCFQIYCRPTYAYFEEKLIPKRQTHSPRDYLTRFLCTSFYVVSVSLCAAAMPFFGDFVALCGAVGFTPLDFVLPALAFLKVGRKPKNNVLFILLRILNIVIVVWYSIVA